MLLVKDIYPNSYHIIACINDEFYDASITNRPKSIEIVKHAFENELISIKDTSLHINKSYYTIYINEDYGNLSNTNSLKNDKIREFATENKHLFEADGRPILK